PSSLLFNTEAEELLVLERFPVHKKMRETIGIGMELLEQPDIHSFRRKHDIPGKYLLYAGRIDAGKGLEELFRFFQFYKEEHPGSGNLQLILIGRLSMKLPESPSIRYIGFVDEGDKLSAMAGAIAVVQPSRMESLSIVTLEAFSVGTPVMATANSRVLADHCRKANAGLYYADFEEFEEILTLLLDDRNLARSLGRNGQQYVKDNYGWNRLLPKYELVFRSSARPAKEPRGARFRGPAPSVHAPAPEAERESVPEASELSEHEERVRLEGPQEHEEPEEMLQTGDLPLMEEESGGPPVEEPPYAELELEAPRADESYVEEAEITDRREPFDELEGEDASFEEEEDEPRTEELESIYDDESEDDSRTEEEIEEDRPERALPREEASSPTDEGGLPEFYRPRPRPTSKLAEETEGTKED
ncbi:MAG: glycosyltransferase family 4 protein, partial [Vicinamibacteria bacterium]